MPKIANIALFDQPQQYALSIRTMASMDKLPMLIGEGYGKIAGYLAQTGALMADVPFVRYHNMDMQNLDVEFAFPIANPIPAQGEIQCVTIPAGKVVACMFQGPYRDMEPLYSEMFQWMKDNGCEPDGTVSEYYFNDPDRPESELLTKIVMPVK